MTKRLLLALPLLALPLLAMAACTAEERAAPTPPKAAVAIDELAWQSATLTVGDQPRQTFQGFGFSFEQDNPYPTLSSSRRAEVDQLLFQDLSPDIIRLWYGPGDPAPIRDFYLDSGLIESARAGGVTEFLLGPWTYLGDPDQHARQIAADVRVIREDYGVEITATGVLNEPEGGPGEHKYLPVEHYVPLAIATRRELDQAGQGDVVALGPEFASADDLAAGWLDVVEADPEALAAVDGFATHSYNMAATPALGARVLAKGKSYWMTEAGGGGGDGSAEFDYRFAASLSSRFLNDLNNGVTHWVWFVGLGEGTSDVYQKLVMCEGYCGNTGRIYVNYGYHHAKQILAAFPPGTVLHHVGSDLDGYPDMTWSYGAKPPLHAAAGMRPDGRLALAVVNDTVGGGWEHGSWDEPANYEVFLDLGALVGPGALTFDLCRTDTEVQVDCGETVVATDGRLTLPVTSMELITLVAQEPS
jgi:hypothetical protein